MRQRDCGDKSSTESPTNRSVTVGWTWTDHVDEPVATHEFHRKVLKPNSQRQDQNVLKAKKHDSKVRSDAVKNLHVEIPLDSNHIGRGECWNLDFDEW